jgi:predicted transcriptional regulator
MSIVSSKDSVHHLSPEEYNQIERFEAAYNTIDRHLRKTLDRDNDVSFVQLTREYSEAGRLWRTDADVLRTLADLRNVLVHGKIKPRHYLAIPTPLVVAQIEQIRDRILRPERVIPKFQKEVETVSLDDSLSNVLKQISQKEYSQFPVYDGKTFKGLLTENGITRWLAHYVSDELAIVDLDEVPIRQVLKQEEKRPNSVYISRNTEVDKVKALFAEHELLEAVLITQSGKREEKLLGIATRWDVIHLSVK